MIEPIIPSDIWMVRTRPMELMTPPWGELEEADDADDGTARADLYIGWREKFIIVSRRISVVPYCMTLAEEALVLGVLE